MKLKVLLWGLGLTVAVGGTAFAQATVNLQHAPYTTPAFTIGEDGHVTFYDMNGAHPKSYDPGMPYRSVMAQLVAKAKPAPVAPPAKPMVKK